ncbi:fatty acid desaturase [Pseudoxanthomonas broegbernensis]|uniref:Fatty acid desaturase n=1 Tax=Pseudoxanthomonas broegbernensis TaxID=83619 RepID=A0A7V8K671_9GAMM|nr:fatty acid desaturase [Pseudoxanthomonas broegbernensis]KAF1684807.1 fatty acid desaturase [Pseudoxanthomonas broegbernensis]MBB6066335.1 fatty acid desaturase [Pseudoxanthomonas broegbernensis]
MNSATDPPERLSVRSTEEDFSANFGRIRREIRNGENIALDDFIKTLAPRYWVVYRDIGAGYVLILATVILAAIAEQGGMPIAAVALISGLTIGYWIAYLQLFIHEGAHWNLAEDRARSDLLANLLIAWWAGQEINAYRKIHFQHHRSLGKTDDSERTYFSPLNPAFIMKGISGLLVLAVFTTRRSIVDTKVQAREKQSAGGLSIRACVIAAGVAIHATIVSTMLYLGLWGVAIGWVMGVGAFFPFFGAMRQLLEHRSDLASSAIDYTSTDHGPHTRMFSDNWFDRTFGGAGFNRHLLHHWLPMISYTRLGDLENFLLGTSLKSIIESRRTTYFRAFRKLFHVH